MSKEIKQYIQNCMTISNLKQNGIECFIEYFMDFDYDFIKDFFNFNQNSLFKVKDLEKFDGKKKDKLLTFIIDFFKQSNQKIDENEDLFYKVFYFKDSYKNNTSISFYKDSGRVFLKTSYNNFGNNYFNILSYFKDMKDFNTLANLIIHNLRCALKEYNTLIEKNDTQAIQTLFVILLNLKKLVHSIPELYNIEEYNLLENEIQQLFQKYPRNTLSCVFYDANYLNEQNKKMFESEMDRSNLSRKSTISAKHLAYLDIEHLKNNPDFSKLINFEIREKTDYNIAKQIGENSSFFVFGTRIAKLKKKLENNTPLSFDLTAVIKALDEETQFGLLKRFNLKTINDPRGFARTCIELADTFGYLDEDNINYIEMLYKQ